MASDAKQKLEEFARQQRLKERLDSGLQAASKVAKQAAGEAGKTAKKVGSGPDVARGAGVQRRLNAVTTGAVNACPAARVVSK